MIDDAELLRRYAEDRSEEAFAEIVRRHIGLVYGKALRTLGYDRHLAEDGTQIVFSLLARKAAALSRRPAVSSWLYVTTGFVAAKMVRTERRRRMREQQAEAMDPLSITHPPSADLNCLYPALDTAMGKLSGRDRTAVLLRFFEGMPYSEIAPALQLSEEAARKRVDRALDKLRSLMVARGAASTSAAIALALADQAAIAVPPGLAASVTAGSLAHIAATSTGPTAALRLLHLMTKTKTAAVIGGILAILSLGSAVYETRRADHADAALAADQRSVSELKARIRISERRLTESDSGGQRLKSSRTPAQDLEDPMDVRVSNLSAMIKARQQSLNDPSYQQLFKQAEQKNTRLTYGQLYQALHLSGGQIDAFENLLAQNAWAKRDLAAVAAAQHLAQDDPAVQELTRQANGQFSAAMLGLLGETGYAQYNQYQSTLPLRTLADQLAGAVYYGFTIKRTAGGTADPAIGREYDG